MGYRLSKGRSLSLSELAPGVRRFSVDVGRTGPSAPLCPSDAHAFVVGDHGYSLSPEYVLSPGRPSAPDGCLRRATGAGGAGGPDGPDRRDGAAVFDVDLPSLPGIAQSVYFAMSVDVPAGRTTAAHCGISGAYVQLRDGDARRALARYDLDEDVSTETAMLLAELYRRAGQWRFRPLGQGYTTGWPGIAARYRSATGPELLAGECS